MKNTIKIFSILFVFACFMSCENNNDLGFNPSPEKGWVQFLETNPDVIEIFQGATAGITLDVNIQVPTTSSDLDIYYDLMSVSGQDPNTVFSNAGSIITPAGSTSYSGPDNNTGIEYAYLNKIEFDIDEINMANLTEPMVFDVKLTGTSSEMITAGLAGESFPVIQRIAIYPSLEGFVGTYTVDEQFTGGVNAPFGLGDFFGESYQVEIARMSGDDTGAKFVITNSAGYDVYFIDNTELTFSTDGSVSFDDGNSEDGFPVVALFIIFEFDTSMYSEDPYVISADGPLGPFGPYQFILTKQ